ncbi:MAG: 50S ribosomal protein L7ae [Oscillospiraceae bacterium]
MDKLFSALSLSRKAGALAVGFDAVKESLTGKKAALILNASDVSQATLQRIENSNIAKVKLFQLPYTQQQLVPLVGKPVGILAVNNNDLAALCVQALLNKEEPV